MSCLFRWTYGMPFNGDRLRDEYQARTECNNVLTIVPIYYIHMYIHIFMHTYTHIYVPICTSIVANVTMIKSSFYLTFLSSTSVSKTNTVANMTLCDIIRTLQRKANKKKTTSLLWNCNYFDLFLIPSQTHYYFNYYYFAHNSDLNSR